MKKIIHVAVGVIFDSPFDTVGGKDRKILIAKRADHQHQGGLWEFPGGKVEEGESPPVALQRELEEELGLQSNTDDMHPIITIPFHYPDKSVLLDVWAVHPNKDSDNDHGYEGLTEEGVGLEGQPVVWVNQADLASYEFPAANKAIIDALLLPKQIAISNDHSDSEVILKHVANTLKNHSNVWLQLRAPSLDQMQYTQLAMKLYGLCHEAGSKLIWNCPLGWYQVAFADGLHLSKANFIKADLKQRPIPETQWFSMGCHNLSELETVQELSDYVLVSTVKETTSHPNITPLTWSGFKVITHHARIPCYALGGMSIIDKDTATQYGGQGIAGISCFVAEQPVCKKIEGEVYES